jgi:hypothetical protein
VKGISDGRAYDAMKAIQIHSLGSENEAVAFNMRHTGMGATGLGGLHLTSAIPYVGDSRLRSFAGRDIQATVERISERDGQV